jgi:hypothetical protein
MAVVRGAAIVLPAGTDDTESDLLHTACNIRPLVLNAPKHVFAPHDQPPIPLIDRMRPLPQPSLRRDPRSNSQILFPPPGCNYSFMAAGDDDDATSESLNFTKSLHCTHGQLTSVPAPIPNDTLYL